jgi:hypothetical protein
MNLEFKEKYLKYKAKYLELKNNLIGGTIDDVNRILEISEYNYEQIFTELHGVINFNNEDEINKAYRKIALKIYPDRLPDTEKERAEKAFTKLTKAKEILISRASLNIASQNERTIPERARTRQERERQAREILQRLQRRQREDVNLEQDLALINNANMNEFNMSVLKSLRRMILEDNKKAIHIYNVLIYKLDLDSLISMLEDINVLPELKILCEKIFEAMYIKLIYERSRIILGQTTQERIPELMEQLDKLDDLNKRFSKFSNRLDGLDRLDGLNRLNRLSAI